MRAFQYSFLCSSTTKFRRESSLQMGLLYSTLLEINTILSESILRFGTHSSSRVKICIWTSSKSQWSLNTHSTSPGSPWSSVSSSSASSSGWLPVRLLLRLARPVPCPVCIRRPDLRCPQHQLLLASPCAVHSNGVCYGLPSSSSRPISSLRPPSARGRPVRRRP